MTKKEIKKLPKYIRFGKEGCAMRLHNPTEGDFGWNEKAVEYYRDAGAWSVGFRIDKKDGKMYSIFFEKDSDLNDVELIPTSYSDWKKDNEPYTGKGTKAYSIK